MEEAFHFHDYKLNGSVLISFGKTMEIKLEFLYFTRFVWNFEFNWDRPPWIIEEGFYLYGYKWIPEFRVPIVDPKDTSIVIFSIIDACLFSLSPILRISHLWWSQTCDILFLSHWQLILINFASLANLLNDLLSFVVDQSTIYTCLFLCNLCLLFALTLAPPHLKELMELHWHLSPWFLAYGNGEQDHHWHCEGIQFIYKHHEPRWTGKLGSVSFFYFNSARSVVIEN